MKECRDRDILRAEVGDEKVAAELWKFSEKQIEALEKEGAVKRALAKKEQEEDAKTSQADHDISKRANGTAAETASTTTKGTKKPGSRRSKKAS